MDYARFFPDLVRSGLAYDPPGSWMPKLPPGCIRLSAGYPFPAAVPQAELAAATAELLAAEGDKPLQYLGSAAMAALPDMLGRRMGERGMPLAENELMVTSGGCQAIDLAARALLGPEDVVAVEAPTYMEALEVFRNYTPHILSYSVDAGGLNVDALATDLAQLRASGRKTPKLLYTIASFQNPTGASLPLERRLKLLELAEAYDFLILEDDAYGELAFSTPPTPLKRLDQSGRVIYIGSLSKVVAPGLRIGWAAAAPPLIEAMALYKKDLDLSFSMSVTARYLGTVDLSARATALRQQYKARCAAMLDALRRHMPATASWYEPGGGFFVWVKTPGVDTAALLPQALAAGVAYVPGKYFYFGEAAGGVEAREHLRLSFSYLPVEEMERGVAILGGLLKA